MKLNDNQLAVVDSELNSILVIAGPGSGKTATLVARVCRLIDAGAPDNSIVIITFTNAAADEFTRRIAEIVGERNSAIRYAGTLHSFLFGMIQRNPFLVGFRDFVALMEEEAAIAHRTASLEKLEYRGTIEAFNIALTKPPEPGRTMSPVQIAVAHYYAEMKKLNTIDFDSMLFFGAQLIRKAPALFSGIEHLFVDEYQDSGDMDEIIYNLLLEIIPNSCIVGDPDQSIYGFRGANVANIIDRRDKFSTFFLEENYRSDIKICEFAQKLIQNNPVRIAKRTLPVSVRPGAVEIRGFDYSKKEALWIAQDIASREIKPEQCAVLCRHNDTAESIRAVLSALCVPIFSKGETPSAGVFVSTIHGAKGLEFHTVYVPAFEQELIPAGKKEEVLEEERRIAFVAFTRAKRRLVISGAGVRENSFTHRFETHSPSQFISESVSV